MSNKKNNYSGSISMLLLLTGLLVVLGCQSKSAGSDLNGGFEINPDQYGNPNSWFATRIPKTSEYVKFEWDSTMSHSGSFSVSLAIDSTHPQDQIAYNWTRLVDNFKIGEEYTISGWIKTEDLTQTAWIVIQCWDANRNLIGFATNQNSQPVKGTSDWTLVETDFTVPDGTEQVRIRAGIASPINNGGKVWFDDISIE